MERVVHLTTPYPSPRFHHRWRLDNVQNRLGPAMRDPSLVRRLPSNAISLIHRLHDPRSLRFAAAPNLLMADDAKATSRPRESPAVENEKKDEAPPAEKLPPPPEKPLPGDCCGSGCVRCVWDVYYEELEEYDNLLKNNSKPS
ncbi:uncharacterized protein LOC131165032 [Malania oleifera]|uniref:uncharacterized protein LOC131165032 n=1 Tax=Malania oleifera TaxID=397392 RepID=UPI0025AE7B29|nr:uncharacterized protein LOC131165032 [Malania oleifera]